MGGVVSLRAAAADRGAQEGARGEYCAFEVGAEGEGNVFGGSFGEEVGGGDSGCVD